MSQILKGAPVASAISERTAKCSAQLTARGIVPTLAILRVGERADDLSYERSAMKKCGSAGVAVKNIVLPENVSNEEFLGHIEALNSDPAVHGALMFLPLPSHLDEEQARRMLAPEKDVDGITMGSQAGVYTGNGEGYPPCTAAAVMEILKFYGISCDGKRAAVLGRSLVIGKPVSMMLLTENATVTMCHSKTQDICSVAKDADILVACTGKMESVGAEYTNPDQVIIDVGISWNEERGKLCGDVRYDEVEGKVAAVTPVPGGVGGVTSAVLVSHVVEAAEKIAKFGEHKA